MNRERSPARTGLTARSLVIGVAMAVLVAFTASWAELVVQRIAIAILQFPPVAFGFFVLLVLGNRAIRHLRAQWALKPGELAVIYVMMVLSAMVSARGAPRRLIGLLTGPNYYANPGNNWETTLFPHVPPHLVPWSPDGEARQPVVTALFEGLDQGDPIPWGAWLGPIAHWVVVIALLFGAFICLATLLRAQWADRERLSFPLAQLPIEMLGAEAGQPFYRNKLLYLGAALPVVIHLINLGHNISPDVPQITLMWDLRNMFFRTPPWNALTHTRVVFSPSAIGFFFLLPKDVLFGLWFFYLFLAKGHEFFLLRYGWSLERPGHADTSLYLASAEAGGFFMLAGYYLYLARPIVIAAVRGLGGRDEMMRYRTALIGLVLTVVAAAGWYYLAGLSLWLGLMELIVYVLVISVVMTRATVEGGLLMTEVIFTPIDVYGMFGRRQLLGPQNLTSIVFATNPFAGDMRGLTLEAMMDGQKIADAARVRRRSLHIALWIALAVALISGFAIQLWLNYRRGAMDLSMHYTGWYSVLFFQEHTAFLNGEERFRAAAPICFVLGAAFTVFLATMRLQFWWWPFHPLAFVMCGSWSLVVYWFAIFVAWILKSIVIRYGGLSGYARARPFFLGLIFGEMSIAVVLTLVDAVWHVPAPYVPFN